MTEFDTERPGLPVPLVPAAPRPSLARSGADAAFVSHLLAARDRLPPQRLRRNATTDNAVGAYARSAQMTVRRMPQGYRTSTTA